MHDERASIANHNLRTKHITSIIFIIMAWSFLFQYYRLYFTHEFLWRKFFDCSDQGEYYKQNGLNFYHFFSSHNNWPCLRNENGARSEFHISYRIIWWRFVRNGKISNSMQIVQKINFLLFQHRVYVRNQWNQRDRDSDFETMNLCLPIQKRVIWYNFG